MAIRVKKSEVIDILAGNYDCDIDLTQFITTASSLVDYVAAQDTDGVLASSNLTIIEMWLSAHFYGHADQFRQSDSTGGASATYQGQTAMVFNSTQYGQTAKMLDFTGTLAKLEQQALQGKRAAGLIWLGTRYADDNSERTSDQ